MLGVILAGGTGSRLRPMTKFINKHVVNVLDEPMIHYPLSTLVEAGLERIVVVGNEFIDQLRQVVEEDPLAEDAELEFVQQKERAGVAGALSVVEPLAADDRVIVILGDNIFDGSIRPFIEHFSRQARGARVLLKRVTGDTSAFGVADITEEKVTRITEKAPGQDNLVATGCYMYDDRVFSLLSQIDPSSRGELEITDLNNAYAVEGELYFDEIPFWWGDCGTPIGKMEAEVELTRRLQANDSAMSSTTRERGN